MPRALADRRAPDDALFSTLNTTPLIDVMLMLLIMLIVTIPSLTHKVPVDLLQGEKTAPPGQPHQLDITEDGSLLWDGAPISDAQLAPLLRAGVLTDAPLVLKTDAAARYERFDTILAQVKRTGVSRLAFVGHERMKFD